MRIFKHYQRLNLALQGGGVHGAFTWGVLERLLGEGDLGIGWMSGTSAGAINAAAVAHGLAHHAPAMAVQTLKDVWSAIEREGAPHLLRLNPFLLGLARSSALPNVTAFFSPYEFNPSGFDPLRKILTQHIDFEAIRRADHLGLLIAATEVATGRARLFDRSEISVEAILASACLPSLHHAVEIDGRAYWDGGFSANPDLITLATKSPVRDTLLVQINPAHRAGVPRGTKSIEDRVNTITFNQPLWRDIETIILAQQNYRSLFNRGNGQLSRLSTHRFHRIAADQHTVDLDVHSKVLPEAEVISALHRAGKNDMSAWLNRYKATIGRRSSFDLQDFFTTTPSQPKTNSESTDAA